MKQTTLLLFIFVFLLVFVAGFLFSKPTLAESMLTKDEAYKAIVQVKTFALGDQYSFSLYGQGSGVIISPNGLLLTNYHVVIIEDEFDNTQRDSIYQVCIPNSIDTAPDCSYMAKLIAADKDYDIALLQIENIPGLSSQDIFSYLNLNQTDDTQVDDAITALGYPTIGGDTITITNGVVSGKMDLYGKKWIKSDATISYGSSGGAAIDNDGNVVGITSQAHSDAIGSLGYIINIVTVNDWINENKNKTLKSTLLTNRLISFAKKEKDLKTNNTFVSEYPGFSITKPAVWDFGYDDENFLMVENRSDDEGGVVGIIFYKQAHEMNLDNIIPTTKKIYSDMGLLSVVSIIKDEPTTINGHRGKKLTISVSGEIMNTYIFPVKNYIVKIIYDYGVDNKDKVVVDTILNSFQIDDKSMSVSETKQYVHSDPSFSINASGNWVVQVNNSKINPFILMNKSIKEAYVDIGFEKTDDNTKNFNNDEYLQYLEQRIKNYNLLSGVLDLKTELTLLDAHYSISDRLDNVIMMELVAKNVGTDDVLCQSLGYVFKVGDNFIAIGLDVYSNDPVIYQNAKTEFNQLMQNFSTTDYCSSCGGDQPDQPNPTSQQIVNPDSKVPENIDQKLTSRLKGRMLLQVEGGGRIWYVAHADGKRHEVTFANALKLFKDLSIGITNNNLAKIKTNSGNIDPIKDSDGDGYLDKIEVASGYNPFSTSTTKVQIDNNLAKSLAGKLLLQVEDGGRIWYVNPETLEKHEVTWGNLMDLFRELSLGITDSDLNKIAEK